MDTGHPITVFLVTALALWAMYLWRKGRLGKPGLLPHPADLRPTLGGQPIQGPPPPGGWQPGTPPGGAS